MITLSGSVDQIQTEDVSTVKQVIGEMKVVT
jgi:hypothetical protein